MDTTKLDELKNTAVDAEGAVENLEAEVASLVNAEAEKEDVAAKRAELKTAKAEFKKATTAHSKEEKRLAREVEKAEKAATKEAEKAEKVASAEAKVQASEDDKVAKAAAREANRMPEQNGIRRPKPGTVCGRTWGAADTLSAEMKQPVPIANLLEATRLEGFNDGNTKAEYARWRKFNNVTGRVTAPKEEVAAEPAAEVTE